MLDWSTHSHGYQNRGAAHLWNSASVHGVAVLWLSPGYGKTSITLHAFKALHDAGRADNMLIVAPLRVVQTVWDQEIENWASLRGLRAARLHGPKKEKQLARRDVNVWLINYEGIPWLAKMVKTGKIRKPFDVVCFDEIRKMKNAQGKRFKAMRPIAAMARYRWGLTGTPASNGLMDLFGQFLILDEGRALGNRITKYRQEFFEQGWDGFSWIPRPNAQERIEKAIEPYVFRAGEELDLPDFIHDHRLVVLDDKARKQYNQLKKDLVASLEETTITADNAAVLYGKLKQMANGRVYDAQRNVLKVHDAKQDALLELIEELGDEQLLIAYEYNHDLEQLREILGDGLPYLGAGVNEKTAMSYVDRWNAGEIQIMAAHPGSAGHGLNLQKSGAHHILWWGPTIDLDFFIQFNDRLRRQGNSADAVVVHTFVAENTVDEKSIKDRGEKKTVQDALLAALTEELDGAINHVEHHANQSGETRMTELTFQSDAAQGAQGGTNPFATQQAQQPMAQNPFTAQQPPAPATNPFATQQQTAASGAAQAPAANPFAGQQQAQQPMAQNPFTAQQPPAPDSVTTSAAPTAGANPFATGGQQQQIMQDTAAMPPATPAQAAPPDQFQQQTGVPQGSNPFATQQAQQPVQDAQVVSETPTPTQPQQTAQQPVNDTGWQPQMPGAAEAAQGNAEADLAGAVTPTPAAGMVPLYLHIPADKMDKVLSAIARAVKK